MTTGKRLLQRVRPFTAMIKGLAHPYRISIVYLLAHEPQWGEDLARNLHIKDNVLLHHVHAMERSGWIKKVREGRHWRYELREKTFRAVTKLIEDSPFWRAYTKPS